MSFKDELKKDYVELCKMLSSLIRFIRLIGVLFGPIVIFIGALNAIYQTFFRWTVYNPLISVFFVLSSIFFIYIYWRYLFWRYEDKLIDWLGD